MKRVNLIWCLILTSLPLHARSRAPAQTDLVIFSFDRPMQLYALLESVEKYIQGIATISVIYRTSAEAYEIGYTQVRTRFGNAHYLKQQQAHADFKRHTLQAAFSSSAPYLFFAVDDIIVTDYIDLADCIEGLESTNAYGFYLRLGTNITQCYSEGNTNTPPPGSVLNNRLYTWIFAHGAGDWRYPNTVDMTIYRKRDIEHVIRSIDFVHPNSLEGHWAWRANLYAKGVCFLHSKMVNLPLNLVNLSANNHMNWQSPRQLLEKFLEGYKINIDTLYKIDNKSPHMNYEPQLIKNT